MRFVNLEPFDKRKIRVKVPGSTETVAPRIPYIAGNGETKIGNGSKLSTPKLTLMSAKKSKYAVQPRLADLPA